MDIKYFNLILLSLAGGCFVFLTACGSSDNNHSKHLGSTDDGGVKINNADNTERDGSEPDSAESIAHNDGGHLENAGDSGVADIETSAPKICFTPDEIDFGSVVIGTAAEQAVEICNCGNKNLHITSIVLEPESSESIKLTDKPHTGTLLPDECVKVTASYTPNGQGTDIGGVAINSDDPTSQHSIVPIYGIGRLPPQCLLDLQPPVIGFSPASADRPGEYPLETLTIINLGDADCRILDITDPSDTDFSILNKPALPTEIKPSEKILLDIEFRPTKLGTIDAKITIVEGHNSYNVILLVTACGEEAYCELKVNPSPQGSLQESLLSGTLLFGNVCVGTHKILPVEFTNTGNNLCKITDIQFSPDINSDFDFVSQPTLPKTIFIGETISFDIAYTPLAVGPSDSTCPSYPFCTIASQWILFKSNAKNEPSPYEDSSGPVTGYPDEQGFLVQLAGTGVSCGGAFSSKEVDFGLVTIGCGAEESTVTVYNIGGSSINIFEASTEPNPPFMVVKTEPIIPKNGVVTIPAGGSMQVTLNYLPADPPKVEEGKLIIRSDSSELQGELGEIPLVGESTYESGFIDEFTQWTEPKVDVLWVVDNSGSMLEVQNRLTTSISDCITYCKNLNLDYHIGVVSTEINEANEFGGKKEITPGHLYAPPGNPKFITPDTPNAIIEAMENIQVGTCCSDEQEAGFEAARLALSEPLASDFEANAGFLREDAQLILFFVSNEDDQSPGDVDYYIDFFKSTHGKKNVDMLNVSVITGLDDTPPKPLRCASEITSAEPGKRYYELYSKINNGLAYSICNDVYDSLFGYGSIDPHYERREFHLSHIPDSNKIHVLVNNVQLNENLDGSGDGWVYDKEENSIIFGKNNIPPQGSKIKVIYKTPCL